MKTDFLSDDDGTLQIKNGDFVIGDNTNFQSKVILNANKGELTQHPLLGVNLIKYLGTSIDIDIIDNAIKTELAKDNIIALDINTTKTDKTITSDLTVK